MGVIARFCLGELAEHPHEQHHALVAVELRVELIALARAEEQPEVVEGVCVLLLLRGTREAHKDMMGVTLKTDALLRSSR